MRWQVMLANINTFFWQGVNIARNEITLLLDNLRWLLILSLGGIFLGVFISYLGYENLSRATITAGKIVLGLTSLAATGLAIYTWIRISAIQFALATGNTFVSAIVAQATAPIPFAAPVQIPQVFTDQQILAVMRGYLGSYAAVAGFAALSAIVPVYTSPGLFMCLYLLMAFIILGASTWAPTGNWVRRFQKFTLGTAVVCIFLFVILFFNPGFMQEKEDQFLMDKAQMIAQSKNTGPIQDQISALQLQRNAILNNRTLSQSDRTAQIQKIDSEIAFLRNGGGSYIERTWASWTGTAVQAATAPPGESPNSGGHKDYGSSKPASRNASRSVKVGDRFTFTVSAQSFLDTGIDTGSHRIRIKVNGGQWKNHPNSGFNAGEGRGPFADQKELMVPKAPLSALVGLIDAGDPSKESIGFMVGNSYEGNPGTGRLLLGINDKEGTYGDNEGSLSVVIEILS